MKAYIIDSLPRLAALCALAVSAVSPALAASINYGDFNDFPAGVVEYQDVTESSATDPVPLFGAPDVVVNQLDFDPQSFGSSASNGAIEITDGQLTSRSRRSPAPASPRCWSARVATSRSSAPVARA